MKYYIIKFASKHSGYSYARYRATLDWISENIVAEIQTGKYGKNPPVHHDERAYYDRGSKFEALIECKPEYIRTFVNGLSGNMWDDFGIHYSSRKSPNRESLNV